MSPVLAGVGLIVLGFVVYVALLVVAYAPKVRAGKPSRLAKHFENSLVAGAFFAVLVLVLVYVFEFLPSLLVAGGVALIVFKLSILLVPAWVASCLAAITGILAWVWAMATLL